MLRKLNLGQGAAWSAGTHERRMIHARCRCRRSGMDAAPAAMGRGGERTAQRDNPVLASWRQDCSRGVGARERAPQVRRGGTRGQLGIPLSVRPCHTSPSQYVIRNRELVLGRAPTCVLACIRCTITKSKGACGERASVLQVGVAVAAVDRVDLGERLGWQHEGGGLPVGL